MSHYIHPVDGALVGAGYGVTRYCTLVVTT
jgi:hypothetical protein